MFALRRSTNFGRVFALLLLRATNSSQGLEQDQIAETLTRNFNESVSVSTISRVLNQMIIGGYCNYTEEKGKRSKRKYYYAGTTKQLAIERIASQRKEGMKLIEMLKEIKKETLNANDNDQNSYLITSIDSLVTLYDVTFDLYMELEKKMKERL